MQLPVHPSTNADSQAHPGRRGILASLLMFAGIVAGYGAGAWHFFRYLVPIHQKPRRQQMFIGVLSEFPVGTSRSIRDPRGQELSVTRLTDTGSDPAAGFMALSTRCPHLGCKAHWEEAQQRFRCPCHEGIFDKQGRAVAGPPFAEGKDLGTYELRVDTANGWIFVMVPSETSFGA